MMTTGAFRLREAERTARAARKGIWVDYVPPPTATAKLSDNFTGIVAEAASGDTVVVRDNGSGTTNQKRSKATRSWHANYFCPHGPCSCTRATLCSFSSGHAAT